MARPQARIPIIRQCGSCRNDPARPPRANERSLGSASNREGRFIIILFPDHLVSFTPNTLEETLRDDDQSYGVVAGDDDKNAGGGVTYLSPDADTVLDPDAAPPATVVIGLLIDRRRIQMNRSTERAAKLSIPTARWPLERVVAAENYTRTNL